MDHINHKIIQEQIPRTITLVKQAEDKQKLQEEIDRHKAEFFAKGGKSEFVPIIVRTYETPEYNKEFAKDKTEAVNETEAAKLIKMSRWTLSSYRVKGEGAPHYMAGTLKAEIMYPVKSLLEWNERIQKVIEERCQQEATKKALKQRIRDELPKDSQRCAVKLEAGCMSRPSAIKYVSERLDKPITKKGWLSMERRAMAPIPHKVFIAYSGVEFKQYRAEDLDKWIEVFKGDKSSR